MFYQWIVKKKTPPTFNQFIKGISNTKSNKMVPVQNIYIITNMIYIKLRHRCIVYRDLYRTNFVGTPNCSCEK